VSTSVGVGVTGSFSGSGSGATSGQSVVSTNTGGGAHNNTPLGMVGTFYLKL
jgi:hypothetical protein